MAGTRIKVKGEISVESGETTSSAANSANGTAWLNAFEAAMLAAGFIRTSDTGQVADIAPANPTTSIFGYRCYALVDEFSATSPLILKAQFAGRSRGTASSSSRRTRCVRLDAAFASDGAGNLTGPQGVVFTLPSLGSSSGQWQGRLDTYSWRKDHTSCVVVSPSSIVRADTDSGGAYVTGACEFFFAASRMRDLEGNLDLNGFNLYGAIGFGVDGTTPRGAGHIPTHLALLADAPAFSASGGACQLISPSSRNISGADSKPLLQPAFRGYTRDGSEYFQPDLYIWAGTARLTHGVPIAAAGAQRAASVMPLGYVCSVYDPSKLHDIVANTSGGITITVGMQIAATDCGLALDWSDE